MDDQDYDPIAESLAAVQQQFAGGSPPDGADTLDASDDVDQTSDDLEATETDESTEQLDADAEDETEETAQAVEWSDPTSPYHPQFLAFQQTEQRKQELETQQERTRGLLDAIRVAQSNKRVNELLQQTAEIDPQLAQQWNGQRVGLIQQTQAAQQETVGYQHGMAAMHLAMTDLLDEGDVQQIVARARELAGESGLDGMQRAVQTRRQVATQKSQRETELENQVKVLRLQVAARKGNPAAELVDSSPARRGKITRPEDAENMDQFFEVFKPFG